jgi:Flp pilus assembly pilin Flp
VNKKADAIIEYAVIIGLVSLAFFAMNTYVKRGLQGRVKDMADSFIGGSQAGTSYSRATSTSQSTRVMDSTLTAKGLVGGSKSIELSETANIAATSRTEDIRKTVVPDASSGTVSGVAAVDIEKADYEKAK